jgi:dTDP-4-dehydrorhamnose 3,5-epimerase
MTEIDGVELLELELFGDDRGAFIETYRREWLEGAREMVQGNLSRSRAGVLRGLHFHRRQADYWFVVDGLAFVALYDLRAGSPTEDVRFEVRLDAGSPRGLLIPAGVAHGFFAESDVVLQYLVDEVFDGSDEFGVAWDDPDIGIAWPSRTPMLSARDGSNPPLEGIERPRHGSAID